jgi:hypothetical protein
MSTTNLFRLDFVIVTVVGSIVGLIFFNPVGYQQAFHLKADILRGGSNSQLCPKAD